MFLRKVECKKNNFKINKLAKKGNSYEASRSPSWCYSPSVMGLGLVGPLSLTLSL